MQPSGQDDACSEEEEDGEMLSDKQIKGASWQLVSERLDLTEPIATDVRQFTDAT